MYRLHFTLVFRLLDEVLRDEEVNSSALAYVSINEVRAALDHALIDEVLKRLIFVDQSEVEEELVPEASIDEVPGGVF